MTTARIDKNGQLFLTRQGFGEENAMCMVHGMLNSMLRVGKHFSTTCGLHCPLFRWGRLKKESRGSGVKITWISPYKLFFCHNVSYPVDELVIEAPPEHTKS